MPCFRPLTGYRSKTINTATGKRSIVFNIREAETELGVIQLPCGQCIHCRLEKSRQWAVRCVHEASLYEHNSFVTLTYRDDALPEHGNLDYEAPVLFMKRLREQYGPNIRSFGCAEYGEKTKRPHYHLCLFNHDFHDKQHYKTVNKHKLYTSPSLEKLWKHGFSTLGSLTFESAAYVARYVVKKRTGDQAYEGINDTTGEITDLLPERGICISRRPGLGRTWLEQNKAFVKNHDAIIIRGIKMRPAKYYDTIWEKEDPKKYQETKTKRKEKGIEATNNLDTEDSKNFKKFFAKNGTNAMPLNRLSVMEIVKEQTAKLLKRGYENG